MKGFTASAMARPFCDFGLDFVEGLLVGEMLMCDAMR